MSKFRCTACDGHPDIQPDCAKCAGTGDHIHVDWCTAPWNRIHDNLWVGGHDWHHPDLNVDISRFMAPNQTSTQDLADAEFDVVISFYRREGCEPPEGVEHHYHRIPDGSLSDEELARVRELAELAFLRASAGKKVLIRCQAGLNRSSLCAAYALMHFGFGPREAIFHIRDCRSANALCNGNFVDYLMQEESTTIMSENEMSSADQPFAIDFGTQVPQPGPTLTFDEYQERAGTTAMYPERGTGSQLALAYVSLGLGEVGEIQGKVKKIIRDAGGAVSEEARLAILGEVGDAQWYLAMLTDELGSSLNEVAQMNLDKLASRKHRGVITGSGDNR